MFFLALATAFVSSLWRIATARPEGLFESSLLVAHLALKSAPIHRWIMRKEYDFSVSRKNPYAAQLKRPVTIRLDQESVVYFKSMAEETGIPYQSLINLYLKECAASKKRLSLAWKSEPGAKTKRVV